MRHSVIALGGGILLGAVAIVRVPEGIASMNGSMLAIPLVLGGGLTFFVIERALGLHRHESPQGSWLCCWAPCLRPLPLPLAA